MSERQQYPSETGTIRKQLPAVDYNARCISCGSASMIGLWPHRNGHGHMIGFVFLCHECSDLAPGIHMDIHGVRKEPDDE